MYKEILDKFMSKNTGITTSVDNDQKGKCTVKLFLNGTQLLMRYHDESEMPENNRSGHDEVYRDVLFQLAIIGASFIHSQIK